MSARKKLQAVAAEYDRTVERLEPTTQRSAWTLKTAIIATAVVLFGSVALVMVIQDSAEARADEVQRHLEQQWTIVLGQVNDRMDDQAAALTRCYESSAALEADVRQLQKLLLDGDE